MADIYRDNSCHKYSRDNFYENNLAIISVISIVLGMTWNYTLDPKLQMSITDIVMISGSGGTTIYGATLSIVGWVKGMKKQRALNAAQKGINVQQQMQIDSQEKEIAAQQKEIDSQKKEINS